MIIPAGPAKHIIIKMPQHPLLVLQTRLQPVQFAGANGHTNVLQSLLLHGAHSAGYFGDAVADGHYGCAQIRLLVDCTGVY